MERRQSVMDTKVNSLVDGRRVKLTIMEKGDTENGLEG